MPMVLKSDQQNACHASFQEALSLLLDVCCSVDGVKSCGRMKLSKRDVRLIRNAQWAWP